MAAYSDINGFPESGFPVLSDVSDRVCLNTLYWNPLKEAGFILDVVGDNRLAGNLSLAGMLSGVTSITMNGALSGVSTITANGTATLTSSNPLSLTDVNANIRMPGLNSSIGSVLERVYKGYFKNLDVANTLTVNGDDVALIGDIKRYVSGTLNTLPKYNATGITPSLFADDGTTPKYNANTLWHSGNDGAGSALDSDLLDGVEGSNYMRNYDLTTTQDYYKTVVGVVRLDNTNPNLDSHAEGKLVIYRTNGNNEPFVVDYLCNKVFNATSARVNYIIKGTLTTGVTITPVTFMYNSVKYFGFSITVVAARMFKALSTFTSDISPFAVSYYNTNTSTILDSEINGSIGSDFVLDTGFKFNNYDVYHANNLNLASVDFTCKGLTTVTAKIGTLSGYLKGTLGTVGAVSSIPQADITNLVSDLSNKQPLDATLTSLAAVAGVQGDLLYASGTDAWTRLVKSTTANSFLKNSGTNNNPAWSVISESDISFTDITTGNSSSTKHGFLPKLSGAITDYLRGDGSWGAGATPGGSNTQLQFNDSSSFGGISGLTYDKTNGIIVEGIPFKKRDIAITPAATLVNGTITSSNSTSITDTSKTLTPNTYIGSVVYAGTGYGDMYVGIIVSNTSNSFTVNGFATTPPAGKTYKIIQARAITNAELGSVISIAKNANDYAILLPSISSTFDRCELTINFDGSSPTGAMLFVIPTDFDTYVSDWYTVQNKYFVIVPEAFSGVLKLRSHNYTTKHWDVESYNYTSYT